jgi:hypothetical protein
LTHSQKDKHAEEQKMKVINDQAHRRVRKPASRGTESRRSGETEHGGNQPGNASGNQQQQGNEEKEVWLRGSKLLQ